MPRFCPYGSHIYMFAGKPAQDKAYNKACATSENSDQPAHPRSLIRVFADRICLLQPPGYPKREKRDPCYTAWMYRLIRVFAGYTCLIVGFVVRRHMNQLTTKPTKWHVRPAKAQISSVFGMCAQRRLRSARFLAYAPSEGSDQLGFWHVRPAKAQISSVFGMCAQRRLRSARFSAQFDQSLRCALNG